MPLSGLPRAERARRGARPEARAEPAQRGRGLAAPEGLVDHRLAAARGLGLRARRARGRRSSSRTGRRSSGCASTASARTRSPSGSSRSRRWRSAAREWERRRTELDYEIDGIVIKVDSLEQQALARRAALAAALGARVQVGADDRADEAEQDRDPRRPHRRAQPVGDARAGRRSAASPSRGRRCTTRRTSTARTSARATA